MSKAQLVFNLPEEDREFRLAIDANKWYCALWDLDTHLRNKLKHTELTDEQHKLYEELRSKLYECLVAHDISFD